MNALRLRFPDREPADLVLAPGVHAIGRDTNGRPAPAGRGEAVAQFCVDRRGAWLQVREGARGVHVNGRPVRRMAMLRAGDAVFVDGVELMLLADEPQHAPSFDSPPSEVDPRIVLRGVGGQHHGRAFGLEVPRVLGRGRDCDVRIDEPALAEHHVRLEPHAEGIVLRDLGSRDGSVVNGHPVRDALLRPGDQLVIDGRHRFVVESPTARVRAQDAADDAEPGASAEPTPAERPPTALPASVRRVPWLLLAALLIAGALSLLLLYGAH